MFNKNKKDKDNSKIGFQELVWIGFTFTCSGIAFTTSFAGIISSTTSGVGWWIFLVIILGSMIFGSISWIFCRFSQMFENVNGGSYLYVRTAFGRFWGWIVGFIQYITIPTSIVVIIISFLDQDIGYLIPSGVPLIGLDAPYQHLVLNLIGILIFFISSFAIYFGLKGLRITINLAAITNWIITFIVIICAIILFLQSGKNNLSPSIYNSKFNIIKFNNAEIVFIYFFTGIENYVTITKNLKNPKKDLGKAILIILILITVFYLLVTFIFIGALGIDSFKNNSGSSGIIAGNNPALEITEKVMGVSGIVIVTISIFASKFNSLTQYSLYSGTTLEPLSIEGYIDQRISKLSKHKVPFRASFLNTVISLILSFVLLIIPNIFKKDIDISTAVGFSSFFVLLIYILISLAILKLSFNKKMKLKWWEFAFAFLSIFVLTWISAVYFISIFLEIIHKEELVINIVQFSSIIFLFLFAIIWYYAYYNPKYKKRISENPELQKELNKVFTI